MYDATAKTNFFCLHVEKSSLIFQVILQKLIFCRDAMNYSNIYPIYKRSIISYSLIFLILSTLVQCATSSETGYNSKMVNIRNDYYSKNYDSATSELREKYEDAADRDKLLYLMEAGIVFHAKGDYKKSINLLKEAESIAETLETSISKETLSLIVNDTKNNFQGESFERVLIKLYIAFGYMMENDFENSKRYFRKINYDQTQMKNEDSAYKQNLVARYLDAIVSELRGDYNDSRVQFKNLLAIKEDNLFLADRFVLANKEKDPKDIAKFKKAEGFVLALDTKLSKTKYNPNMGELIILNQGGKAPLKKSRGKISDSPEFTNTLNAAVEIAIRAQGAAVTSTAVVLTMSQAENPIPEYVKNSDAESSTKEIYINNNSVGTTDILFDYEALALKNFNEKYPDMVKKNIANFAAKAVAAAVIANSAVNNPLANKSKDKIKENACGWDPTGYICPLFVDLVVDAGAGAAAGAIAGSTFEPDLRCWSLLPANIQMKRIYLAPGTYEVKLKNNNGTFTEPFSVTIEPGKPVIKSFISVSSDDTMSGGTVRDDNNRIDSKESMSKAEEKNISETKDPIRNQDSRPTASSNREKYGMAGCGLGSLLIEEKGKGPQIIAATTNNTYSNQIFPITTGTSNCTTSGIVTKEKEQEVFVHVNFESIEAEMATGKGEKLNTLASLFGCSNSKEFKSLAKDNYLKIFNSKGNSPSTLLATLKEEISKNQKLSSICTL